MAKCGIPEPKVHPPEPKAVSQKIEISHAKRGDSIYITTPKVSYKLKMSSISFLGAFRLFFFGAASNSIVCALPAARFVVLGSAFLSIMIEAGVLSVKKKLRMG